MSTTTTTFNDLTNAITQTEGVEDSAITLIDGLAQALVNAQDPDGSIPADEVETLITALNTKTSALAAAVAANPVPASGAPSISGAGSAPISGTTTISGAGSSPPTPGGANSVGSATTVSGVSTP